MVCESSTWLSLSLINSALPRQLRTLHTLPNQSPHFLPLHCLETTNLNLVFIMPLEFKLQIYILFNFACL